MIRINLLPKEQIVEIRGIGNIIVGFGLIAAVILLLVAINVWKSGELNEHTAKLDKINSEVKELEKIKAKVDAFKIRNKELIKRINVIKVLEENRTGPLFVMDSLGQVIPSKAWIDGFTIKGLTATMNGIAWNEQTVADFLRGLEKSPYFERVELKEIKTKKIKTLNLKTYKITTKLNFSGKKKQPAKKKPKKKGPGKKGGKKA